MSKDFAKKFYNSKAWKSCRDSYIDKRINYDGGLCERCHQVPGYIIHHKTHLTPNNIDDPDITLNHCNLEYVCHLCHNDIHEEDMRHTNSRVAMMVNGRLIPFEIDDGDRFKKS